MGVHSPSAGRGGSNSGVSGAGGTGAGAARAGAVTVVAASVDAGPEDTGAGVAGTTDAGTATGPVAEADPGADAGSVEVGVTGASRLPVRLFTLINIKTAMTLKSFCNRNK